MITDEAAVLARARQGDASAIDQIIRALQDPIYRLSLRFLGSVGDAEDATQEILLKVVTHLGAFRGDSKISTWAYRVASNHLVSMQRKKARMPEASFEMLGSVIDGGLVDGGPQSEAPKSAAHELMTNELRLTCTQGMLLALDRDHRLAFVLSDILELHGKEASEVLAIEHDTFRKRVSRARERLADFMRPRCGVFDAKNLCRCEKQVARAIEIGTLPADPALVQLSTHAARAKEQRSAHELLDLLDVAAVMRTHPEYVASERVKETLQRLLHPPLPPLH